jgi:D-alanyl-D-alanine-carboxypeptidase/D-alanyl-D-alanine-endopeptidase
MNRLLFRVYLFTAMAVQVTIFGPCARADDKLLDETVEFTGTVLFLQSHVPALVIGALRDGQTAVFGFGEATYGSGKTPDRHTMLGIGCPVRCGTGTAA